MKSYWVNSEVTKTARSQTIKRNNNFAYNASLLDQITPLAWEAMDTHDEFNPANAKLTDDVTKAILQEIREFPIDESQEIFPRLTKDQISYNVIPIIKVKATHVITDKVIDLVMADVRGETILVKQDDAMAVNQNLSNNIKSFIGKTFKTKSYSEKTDRLSQIKLMIYVAKADGTIDEEEKLFINECVNSLTDLTKKEKLVLINMLSAKCLPPLSKEVIVFSSQSKGEEIISSLEQLAQSDGLYHEHEKKVIEKVRMLL